MQYFGETQVIQELLAFTAWLCGAAPNVLQTRNCRSERFEYIVAYGTVYLNNTVEASDQAQKLLRRLLHDILLNTASPRSPNVVEFPTKG